jgi:type II secretory pathway component PulF
MAIIFHYRGFNANGEKTAGSTKAATVEGAREDLRRRGVVATRIEPDSTWYSLLNGEITLPGKKRESQILFFRTLAMLVRAGKDTDQALGITIARASNKVFRESLQAVRAEMNAGASLSEALATRPDSFSDLQVGMIRIGEKSGAVDEILERLASFLENERSTARKISGAIAYPVVVLLSSIGLLIFMFTTIIPSFASFFVTYDVALPPVTRALLDISHVLTQPFTWLVVAAAVVGIAIVGARALSSNVGRMALDRVRLRLPLVGPLISKSIVARTARLLATLLQSGVDIDEGLEILIPVTGSVVFAAGLEDVREDLAAGAGFVSSIEATNLFDSVFIALVDSGQETGAIDRTLVTAAEYYEEEVSAAVNVLNAALQPALLLVLGVITALIAIGVYLPLYQLVSNVK